VLAPLAEPSGRPPASPSPLQLVDPEALDLLRHRLASVLDPAGDLDPALAGVVRDTLDTPGSLWRPQLAWAIGRAHGLDVARALDLALGVECFHVASLLFDDLPAMDDSSRRRGRPAAHVVHGDGAAILAALAFVHRGYRFVWAAFGDAPAELRAEAGERVEAALGLAGILDGQARDLGLARRRLATLEEIERAARGKTEPLLRLALELPALAGGADASRLDALSRLAAHWGLAYQILDDLEDLGASGGAETAETDAGRGRPNLAVALGVRGALRRLDLELEAARRLVGRLAAALGEMPALDRLEARFASTRRAVSGALA